MSAGDILRTIPSLIWPAQCAACGKRVMRMDGSDNEPAFCPTCAETLEELHAPYCTSCGLPFGAGTISHRCALCLQNPPAFEHARATFYFGGAIQDAIWRLKYRNAPHLAKSLARFVIVTVRALDTPDAVVPIPLHGKRLRARGYNQAALIAQHVASSLGITCQSQALKRVRDTTSQSGLTRVERMTNLSGAFVVKRPQAIAGRRILLIDDVITTTATVRAASWALMEAGAIAVDVAALARAADPTLLAPHCQTG